MGKRKATESDAKVASQKKQRNGTAAAQEPEDVDSEEEEQQPKKKGRGKASGGAAKPGRMNATETNYESLDFSSDATAPNGNKWNLKISSWNVNGLRAVIQKKGLDFVLHEKPDIFCLQETKCSKEQLPSEASLDGYKEYWLSGDSEGYSGVGLYSKHEPKNVTYGIGDEKHDKEGRVITAEYEDYYVVCAYVPNAGRGLVRLAYRQEWDVAFRDYLSELDKKKPVILTGDLNVAHKEIDLANPKTNKKNAGFTTEERDAFTALLEAGFIDSYRQLYPEKTSVYTFWTYMMNARSKNVGWRLDYFVISEKLKEKLCDSVVRSEVLGSDHCPITLLLAV